VESALTEPPSGTVDEVQNAEGNQRTGSDKRAAAPADEDEGRWKLRKKTAAVGLGEIYDPGIIAIKPKEAKAETASQVDISMLGDTTATASVTDVSVKEEPLLVKLEETITPSGENASSGRSSFRKRKTPLGRGASSRGRRSLLHKLVITFFHQLIFDTPQLSQFIGRTPKFKAHLEAHVILDVWDPSADIGGALELGILYGKSDWQLSSVTQLCSSSFPRALIPMVDHLYIQCGYLDVFWRDDIENRQRPELLHPFSAVKHLYISWGCTPRVAPALQDFSRKE
jgi:hypothetical protein